MLFLIDFTANNVNIKFNSFFFLFATIHGVAGERNRTFVPIRPCHTAAILSRETKPSVTPMVSTARLGVVKQSSFGLPGQYGRPMTRAN